MKILILILLTICSPLAAQDIVGFWKSVDEHTSKPQSIVAIYEYQGKYYGRIIATYNENGQILDTIYTPKEKAPGVVGNPYYSGLDIIYDVQKEGDRYKDGKIVDPQEGKVYDTEIWIEDGNLIVRGEVLFFGRNQTWPPALDNDFPTGFKKPDLTQLVPQIPQVVD
ncbi:MAG: DUF2147 domain-containing protein [Parachlamydia sp.]|nr:DUF2147 domain-containing protein [Parachlamydia sp.]